MMVNGLNTVNNADYGLTLQEYICNFYDIPCNSYAEEQFCANHNSEYENELEIARKKIFELVKSDPIELLTYTMGFDQKLEQRISSPHNFLLKNQKTLSIRTTKSSGKVSPRTIGQAGYKVLNDFFEDIFGRKIENQYDIKQLVYYKIDQILPYFIDRLFQSDYTIYLDRKQIDKCFLIKSSEIGLYTFSRDELTFSKDLENWNESTTLYYKGVSIAEIQVHRNRTFKFRFIINHIQSWLHQVKETTETFGISAEAAICELFTLKQPKSFDKRASRSIIEEIAPTVKEAFTHLPNAIKHSGSDKGSRGGRSKSSYDFILEGNETLSLKTNKGKMVCPPEVGQPNDTTCYLYFKDLLPKGDTTINKLNFKNMVYNHIEKLIPIYISHLFDSNWLLWIYYEDSTLKYEIISNKEIRKYKWDKNLFTFTKETIEQWKESNTVKYNNLSIGEFQIHNNRNCFKFRFNLQNLLTIIK